MNDVEFFAKVRDRGRYTDQAEAERVIRAVLTVLGQRLTSGEVKELAAKLPAGQRDALPARPGPGESFGAEEFCKRVASALDTSPEIARWDSSAVLSTVAEVISGGRLSQMLTQLQSDYAVLFGKPELA